MAGLIIILAIMGAIAAFDILAQKYGVDSRPSSDDPRAPVRGISI